MGAARVLDQEAIVRRPPSGVELVVGRQPIFDRNLSVIAYELVFRGVALEAADLEVLDDGAGRSGDLVCAGALFAPPGIGVERLVGDKKAFCNVGRDVLVGEMPLALAPERTVLEVLESVVVDGEALDRHALDGCRRRCEDGFTLALDRFTWSDRSETLLELASVVKIDVAATGSVELAELLERCRRFDLTLVAQNVETVEELRRCDELGFDTFQGYLPSRPRVAPGRVLDPGQLSRLRMSARLLDGACDVAEIEEIVRSDPAMTHQLLQLAGLGAAGGMRRTVRTVREALVLVGWRRLQSWVSLLLLTGQGATSHEEITTALVRARMCELVAASGHDRELSETAFTSGMLSCLDVLLGVPLAVALDTLPLDPQVREALLEGSGTLGALVGDVTDYLTGRPDEATRRGIDEVTLSAAALGALTWAVECTTTLSGPEVPVAQD